VSDDSIHAVHERVNRLATQTDAQRFRLVIARTRVRRRIDRVVHRRGALLGMFVAGLVFGSLPAPKPHALRRGVKRLPGGLMSIVLIALRVQSAMQRLARAASPSTSAPSPAGVVATPIVARRASNEG
jgi:hypothetical protein